MPSSRGSSGPKDRTGSLMSPALAAGIFTIITTWEAHSFLSVTIKKQPCCGLGFQHVNSASIINAQGTGHPGAPEAAVPIRVLAQVLLVVILHVVKGLSLPDAW